MKVLLTSGPLGACGPRLEAHWRKNSLAVIPAPALSGLITWPDLEA